jgi:glucose/arabinose dehydrogenase
MDVGNVRRPLLAAAALVLALGSARAGAATQPACPSDAGLKLPAGFCATVFADHLGHARHLTVAPNGVVYVNTWSGRYYGNKPPHDGGFLVALRDTTGNGKANVIERFGPTAAEGGSGGTGILLYKGALYVEMKDKIVKYTIPQGQVVPSATPEVVVSGLPLGGDHPMHPFTIDADGMLYIDVASATNSCQEKNRTLDSPGIKPCTELETRGGIWRYDAKKLNQKFSPAERYATGIRNGEGIAADAGGHTVYATQHGRDQLHQNFPKLYKAEEEASLPAEELVQLKQGGDYGWPFCYFDDHQGKLVLAPEYGGDGGKTQGLCAQKLAPVAAFPAHWAPDGLLIYTGTSFPERYRNGAFIAFHGSWDRAPYPQGGYNVVFQPLGTSGAGKCEVFADGFAGARKDPGHAEHRPVGVALGPDGSLYVSDDAGGRIYRISYRGGEAPNSPVIPCYGESTAGAATTGTAVPPEGVHPNAGAAAQVPVPAGATAAMVAAGAQVFRGQAGGAACTGCHGTDGSGTPLGPDLTAKTYNWSDGSYAGIEKVIKDGVPQPKNYRGPMPPEGGAQLTSEQLKDVAAYVWGLSHH